MYISVDTTFKSETSKARVTSQPWFLMDQVENTDICNGESRFYYFGAQKTQSDHCLWGRGSDPPVWDYDPDLWKDQRATVWTQ